MSNELYPFSRFVGVDVSKAKLDVALDQGERPLVVGNSKTHILKEVIRRIDNPEATIVVMGATRLAVCRSLNKTVSFKTKTESSN